MERPARRVLAASRPVARARAALVAACAASSFAKRARARTVLVAACAALGLAGTGRPALANGRFPSAQQLLVDPSDDRRLWLRATYGVLTSGDAGKTWQWVCEPALGIAIGEDPFMVVTADGTALVGGSQGLFETRDHGCTFTKNADTGSQYVRDLAMERDATHVLTLTSLTRSDGSYDLAVSRSEDAGHHFTRLPAALPPDLLGLTLDVAPSDPSRLYATAVPNGKTPSDAGMTDPAACALLRSRDAGVSWERVSVPGTAKRVQPYIAAVDPSNPDVLYVRVRGDNQAQGFVENWLLRSDDAGDTFREIFRGPADMLGFALAPNGEVLLGLGDSHDITMQRAADPAAIGVYRAAGPDFGFERGLAGQVGCLTSAAAGLYVCGSHASERFEVGLSNDLGSTAVPILDYGSAITGPPQCGADTGTTAMCRDDWEATCAQLRACRDGRADGGTSRKATASDCSCRSAGTPADEGLHVALLVVCASSAALGRRRRRPNPGG